MTYSWKEIWYCPPIFILQFRFWKKHRIPLKAWADEEKCRMFFVFIVFPCDGEVSAEEKLCMFKLEHD